MNKSLDVQYITCTYAELPSVNKIAGQLIALRDKDACFYDMIDKNGIVHRRSVSGINVVYGRFSDDESGQPEGIYLLADSADEKYPSGLYLWIPSGNQVTKQLTIELTLKKLTRYYTENLSVTEHLPEYSVNSEHLDKWQQHLDKINSKTVRILEDISGATSANDDVVNNVSMLCYKDLKLDEFACSFEFKNNVSDGNAVSGAIFGLIPKLDTENNVIGWNAGNKSDTSYKGIEDTGVWFKPYGVNQLKVCGTFTENGIKQVGKSKTVTLAHNIGDSNWHTCKLSIVVKDDKQKYVLVEIDSHQAIEFKCNDYYVGGKFFIASNNNGTCFRNINLTYDDLVYDGDYVPVATINTDENVKLVADNSKKFYISGTTNSESSTGSLIFNPNIYIDENGTLVIERVNGKADSAKQADTAKSATKATQDENGNNITGYVRDIELSGGKLKKTDGKGKVTYTGTLPDTHYQANLVVTNSPTGKTDVAAKDGQVHINLVENNTVRNSHPVTGKNGTHITSDTSGNIIIETDGSVPNTNTQDGYVKAPGAHQSDKVWGLDDGGNPNWVDKHPKSNSEPGSYTKVTIDKYGHVVSGDNPNSLAGYGITDGMPIIKLPRDADLNDIKSPGFYIGVTNNIVKNKPRDVSSFGMQVIPTSDAEGYVSQVLYGSGEYFIEKDFILTQNLNGGFVYAPAVEQASFELAFLNGDYPAHLSKVNMDRGVDYDFMNKILVYICEYSEENPSTPIPIDVKYFKDLFVEGGLRCEYSTDKGKHRLYLQFPYEMFTNRTAFRFYVPKGTVLPSYQYCNNGGDVQVGFETNVDIEVERRPDSDILILTPTWTNLSDVQYSYCSTTMTVVSVDYTITTVDNEQVIKVTLIDTVEEISINGNIQYEGIVDDATYCYIRLSNLTKQENDVRITCSNGYTYQVSIKNSEGTAQIYPEGQGSKEQYSRNCVNSEFTPWQLKSMLGWSEYNPE